MKNISDNEQKKIFSENLSYYVRKSGRQQKDIALDLGFNVKTFNGWCKGLSMPTMGKVQAIADYFHIGKTDLVDKRIVDSDKKVASIRIPVLGRIAAGLPLEATEHILDWEELPESMAHSGEYFGLIIQGDSMIPDIHDGDIVIVRQQPDAENGEVVVAMVNSDDAVCKRLMKYSWGLQLMSDNPAYEPLVFSAEEVEDKPVRILGKVVELRRKY